MIKIAHVREIPGLQLPREIVSVIQEAVTILDMEYGEDRDGDCDYGGYVLMVESERELGQLKEVGLDLNLDVPEYVDTIACSNGQVFTSRLFLQGSDYGIVVVMPAGVVNERVQDL